MNETAVPCALIVDDSALILMQVAEILEKAGFQCHEAMDGEEALQLLDQHHASIVLLFADVDLGDGINGFAVARHVDVHWPHIEIVMASGHVLPRTDDMPEKATFIVKPFGEQTVVDHLTRKLPDAKKPEPLRRVGRQG